MHSGRNPDPFSLFSPRAVFVWLFSTETGRVEPPRSALRASQRRSALPRFEVCVLAGPKELADLARGFMRAGVPRELVAPFFEALEELGGGGGWRGGDGGVGGMRDGCEAEGDGFEEFEVRGDSVLDSGYTENDGLATL